MSLALFASLVMGQEQGSLLKLGSKASNEQRSEN